MQQCGWGHGSMSGQPILPFWHKKGHLHMECSAGSQLQGSQPTLLPSNLPSVCLGLGAERWAESCTCQWWEAVKVDTRITGTSVGVHAVLYCRGNPAQHVDNLMRIAAPCHSITLDPCRNHLHRAPARPAHVPARAAPRTAAFASAVVLSPATQPDCAYLGVGAFVGVLP